QGISGAVPASLEIYNICGQKIDGINLGLKNSGTHSLKMGDNNINSRPVSAGIYFYRLTAGKLVSKGKFVVLK
ncbi:MAG: T9SS type A sorting domain-containing protein, partial [bacterium]|nr:T9SS type A sorting domain-containing protein [bacterium]